MSATHYIKNIPEFREEFKERKQVGNAMSTTAVYSPQTGEWVFYWKRGEPYRVKAPEGAVISVSLPDQPPRVNVPPRDPVALAAWEKRFFKGKRCESWAELREKCAAETRYDNARGYEIPACSVYESNSGNCAVAYRAAMEGQRGVPFLWWANAEARPDEMRNLIEFALGFSALHIYS